MMNTLDNNGKIIFNWNDEESFSDFNNIDNKIEWKRWNPGKNNPPVFNENKKISVSGKTTDIGGYETTIPVSGGKTYKLDVEFITEGIKDINLHVLNLLRGNIDPNNPKSESNSLDGVTNFKAIKTDGDKNIIAGSMTVKISDKVNSVSVMLGIRYCDGGTVTWNSVKLSEVMPIPPRKAVVAVTKRGTYGIGSFEKYIELTNKLCAEAASKNADIFVMPEFSNMYSGFNEDLAEEITPESPTYKLISENAKKYNMYICTAIVEKCDGNTYNTAVIFDRNGKFIGKYRKVHLYFPEELLYGTVPGDEQPVFDLDFGRIGVVICYDSWFAESFRLLGLKGAELVLFPNAGYEPKLMPARAIDNSIYIAVSSIYSHSSVVNSLGDEILTINENYSVDAVEIDLSQRPLPHANSGGNMNGSPGGKRLLRHSHSTKLYEEILKEISEWENRDTVYTWL